MESQHQKHTARKPLEITCTNPSCFFCSMNEQAPSIRRAKIVQCFKELPLREDQENVLVLSGLFNIAINQPDDPEFPSLGVFECMTKLIQRGISDKEWLLRDQNIYIPYYAAHIIGSYTMNKAHFAEKAVRSGVVLPLMELLRGKISWVEQRVAVRALGHLASHEKTFEAVALHEVEIIGLTMKIACECFEVVYEKFVGLKEKKRVKYHCDLLTRGLGGLELENRKAEEWASQLQCWSLYLLNCFACKERCLNLICSEDFLKIVCDMWGGLANHTSPAGIGLIRTLCNTKAGREHVAKLKRVIESLCNVSRSSDDWQYVAIDSLLLLLKDQDTRYEVIDTAALFLVDLVELKTLRGRKRLGEAITQTLLQDYHKIKYGGLRLKNKKAERALEEIWDMKVEKIKREKLMSEQEMKERELSVYVLKQEANTKFWSGNIEKAVKKYTKALDLCPLKMRKERIVLYSNRAQCYLMLKKPEAAISDTTRALCLSGTVNSHSKSLWRRSQAYDMKGLAKESLMDSSTFISSRMKSKRKKRVKIPYYAAVMINKQMNATWPFNHARSKRCKRHKEQVEKSKVAMDNKSVRGMPTIMEEKWTEKTWKRRKLERARRRKKEFHVTVGLTHISTGNE
ncbi:Tetratricopeptide repeat protein like [Melia azedarach]|uniref:Tetratricopeptide repeat protein like n=1 Tax=Melia azedarach TaxID=155640 RepID=A0ACC1XVM9_MELAZ|nr:Tetratricopeptide repeat protein like [Melia azedarach]